MGTVTIDLGVWFANLLYTIPLSVLVLIGLSSIDTYLRLGDVYLHENSIVVVLLLRILVFLALISQLLFGIIYLLMEWLS